MSRSELVSAYQNGRIDRRTLIKGLSALGLSVTVATALADKARAVGGDDTYDDVYEEDGGVTLPATGVGGGGSKSSWAAPAAILGGAAAVIATRIRRTKPSDI